MKRSGYQPIEQAHLKLSKRKGESYASPQFRSRNGQFPLTGSHSQKPTTWLLCGLQIEEIERLYPNMFQSTMTPSDCPNTTQDGITSKRTGSSTLYHLEWYS